MSSLKGSLPILLALFLDEQHTWPATTKEHATHPLFWVEWLDLIISCSVSNRGFHNCQFPISDYYCSILFMDHFHESKYFVIICCSRSSEKMNLASECIIYKMPKATKYFPNKSKLAFS